MRLTLLAAAGAVAWWWWWCAAETSAAATPTRRPTSRAPTKKPTSRAPTTRPTSRAPTKKPTETCEVKRLFPAQYGFAAQFTDSSAAFVGFHGLILTNEAGYQDTPAYAGSGLNTMGEYIARVKLQEEILDMRIGYSSAWLLTRRGWVGLGTNSRGELSAGHEGNDIPLAGDFTVEKITRLDVASTHVVDVQLYDRTTYVLALNSASGFTGVKSFGDNLNGQAGWGTNTQAVTSVGDGLPWLQLCYDAEDVEQVVSGLVHACFLGATSGKVRCIGKDERLGIGANRDFGLLPSDMGCNLPHLSFVDPVVKLAAAATHTCSLHVTGHVLCWGSSAEGALGQGSETHVGRFGCATSGTCLNQTSYVDVGAPGRVVDLVLGAYVTYVFLNSTQIRAFGYVPIERSNYRTPDTYLFPAGTTGVISIVTMSAGVCFLDIAHVTHCVARPQMIGGETYSSDYVDEMFQPALQCADKVVPYPTARPTSVVPTRKPSAKPTRKPTAAPTKAGQKKPTGKPTTKTPSRKPTTRTPTRKPSSSKPTTRSPTVKCVVKDLVGVEEGFLAVLSTGRVKYWGLGRDLIPTVATSDNDGFPLYIGSLVGGPPQEVPLTDSVGIVRVVAGRRWVFALTAGGQWRAFGENLLGVLGIASKAWPQDPWEVGNALPVLQLNNIVDIHTGGDDDCGQTFARISVGGSVRTKSWGCNGGHRNVLGWTPSRAAGYGALTHETLEAAPIIDWCNNDTNVTDVKVSGGGRGACILFQDGTSKCTGEFADNYPFNTRVGCELPKVDWGTGLSVMKLSMGFDFVCAVLAPEGKIKCFGGDSQGQLGNDVQNDNVQGSQQGDAMPFAHLGAVNRGFVDLISPSWATHSFAVHANRTVYPFGGPNSYNVMGFVGSPELGGDNLPTMLLPLPSTSQLRGASEASCLLNAAGEVRCWGSDAMNGLQVGDWYAEEGELQSPGLVMGVCGEELR